MKKDARILAVDDSSTNIFLIEGVLGNEGYQIQTAYNAKDAMDMIKQVTPDLILLDLMMPQINGYKLLEQIRLLEQTKKTPVIIISAKKEQEDIDRAMELGATDFINKPVNIQKLIDKVDFLLEQVSDGNENS